MQNSNPSPNVFSYPSLLQQLLERTFLGTRPASAGAAPGDESTSDDAGLDTGADTDAPNEADATGRLELAELLDVLRDPIAWVFTLAERRAQGDPIDIAAIHRVRDAVLHRVNATIAGAPSAPLPRIRSADLLTVGGLLIDSVDPGLVHRAMQSVGTHIADTLAAGLQLDPSLVAHVGRTAAPFVGPHMAPSVPPSWYFGTIPARPVAPCSCGASMPYGSGAHGGHYAGPHALPPVLRPSAPPWCWPSSPFGF